MTQDRMQHERFELKYLVDETKARGIRDFVSSFLVLDEACAGKPDFSYPVHSLYLDSALMRTFWDWVNANRTRFKLRMRFYEANPESPVFVEIKRSLGGCIRKRRCAIRQEAAPLVLAGHFPPPELLVSKNPKNTAALEEILVVLTQLHARPKALVSYRREAYVHPANSGVRLTLDRQVRIAPRETCDFRLEMDRYTQPFGDQVVLELKFQGRFPGWFNDLVRQFDLARGAAAKYCEGVAALWHPEHAHFDTRLHEARPVADAQAPPDLALAR